MYKNTRLRLDDFATFDRFNQTGFNTRTFDINTPKIHYDTKSPKVR
jgi:hypothetical protein